MPRPLTPALLLCAALTVACAGTARPAEPEIAPVPVLLDSLTVHEGRTVRAIELPPGLKTKEYVVHREFRTKVGEPLDRDVLAADRRRLENLSIFSEVNVTTGVADSSGVVVRWSLTEMPLVVPMLGFRYTEEDGFSVGPGVSSLNLGGRALAVSGRAYFGKADQFWGKATWPWIAGDHLSFEAYLARLERQDIRNDFHEKSDEFYARLGSYVGEHGRTSARFWLLTMRSATDGITLSPTNEDHLHGLFVTAGFDSRDSFRTPRAGWQNEIEIGKVGGWLGGDGDYEALTVDVRRWFPTGRTTKLLLSGLMSIQSGTTGVDVPLYMRYQIGGANSVRGWPVDGPETALAGRNQLIGTAEHSFTLMPIRRFDVIGMSFAVGLDAVAFGDAGIAWNDKDDLAMNLVRTGVGGGLRLLVPGSEMLRFEIGWNGMNSMQFHFASGGKPTAQRSRNR